IVGAVHDVFVGPLEIEGVNKRLAKPSVFEFLAPRVEEPALRARWRLVRQNGPLNPAIANGGKNITRGPDPRRQFLAKEVDLAAKTLESHVAVTKELITQRIEIVLTAYDGQVRAPPILDTVVLDEASDLQSSHLVGTAAERHFHRRLVE